MKVFNTLTKQKEEFIPLQSRKVGMYHCGPTVYDFVHIGNLRSFIMADTLRRGMEYIGYDVLQVMNITDVGHLVSDGDTGEDKMTKGLKRKNLPITLENMLLLADEYTTAFISDLKELNIKIPHHLTRASEHINEDIVIIRSLEEKGFIYKTHDGIYFDTTKMPDYGKLGGIISDDMQSRITENTEKKNPRDFALWKFDEKLGWESPWGLGFPGWHIECSGMSMKYLGETFDIHTGGMDLASVHHNNEIAQSECATGRPFARYWLHNEFINVESGKMSKSEGTGFTLRSIIEKGFESLSYRYWILQGHYRSPMTFSWNTLDAAQNGLKKLYRIFSDLPNHAGTVNQDFKKSFMEKIEDDLNTPQALAVVHEMLKSDISDGDKRATLLDFDQVLGLDFEKNSEQKKEKMTISDEIQTLLNTRKKARDEKNWSESDRLRDEIKNLGFEVKDTDEGQKIEKI